MPITYSIAVDRNHDGDYADTDELITADVLTLWWRRGMTKSYDSMASPAQARITVHNPNRDYSPEANALLPGQRIRIRSDDGTSTRTHFTGIISQVEPQSGDQGGNTAFIRVEGVEAALSRNHIGIAPLQEVTADSVIESILDQTILRRAVLDGYLIVGISGYNVLDTHKLFGENIPRNFESGKSIFAYVGDTWGVGIQADVAILEAAVSERGRFFVDQGGEAVFYNRHHALLNTTLDATFSDDMDGLTYAYGADTVNRIEVTITPRSIGAEGTILWQLSNVQALPPGSEHLVSASFRDEDGNSVGALTVIPPQEYTDYTANANAEGTSEDRTSAIRVALLESGASAATLSIRNESRRTVYLQTLQIRGTPLIQGDRLTVTEADHESIPFFGLQTMVLDLPALTSLDEAEQMARYELARRKDPRGIVRTLQTSTRTHPVQTLSLTLFDRIRVIETQTDHDAEYFIVGEEHQIDHAGTHHQVRWLLEPADDDRFIIIGNNLDDIRVLAY